MKKIRLKPILLASRGKTSINLMIFVSIFLKNCFLLDAIHDFSVKLRTGSNPTFLPMILCYKKSVKIVMVTLQSSFALKKYMDTITFITSHYVLEIYVYTHRH